MLRRPLICLRSLKQLSPSRTGISIQRLLPTSTSQTVLHREYAGKSRTKMKWKKTVKESLDKMHIVPYDPEHCSGCGIKLQADDINKAGYVYNKKELTYQHRERVWQKRRKEQEVIEDALRNLDYELIAKLANEQKPIKEVKEQPAEEFRGYEEDDEMFEEEMEYDHDQEPQNHEEKDDELSGKPLPEPGTHKPNFCRRCHLLTYHSDPVSIAVVDHLTPKNVNSIIRDIEAENKDPENPPVILHVIDLVDFPLSFIPFKVPYRSKVMFIINRADAVCERSNAMAHVRAYFRQQLPLTLKDAGMNLEAYEIHPVSALKGWGVRELRERIFEMRNRESNVYLIGISLYDHVLSEGSTNVGKSSLIAAMLEDSGIAPKPGKDSNSKFLSPTVSVFPHTTLGHVRVPLNAFRSLKGRTKADLYDTPGVASDSTYFSQFIAHNYSRAVSLLKRGGYTRPPDKMTAGTSLVNVSYVGQSMVLGGLVRIDLLECDPHETEGGNPHIRITLFSNLPMHMTSLEKAVEIFDTNPAIFWSRKSSIETVTTRALGKDMRTALELEVKSTGNSVRNTIEIVLAGLGWIAIGGNFGRAKIAVWTPAGRGVGIRQPIVQMIGQGYSLTPVKRQKIKRMKFWAKKEQVNAARMMILGTEKVNQERIGNEGTVRRIQIGV